MSLVEQVVGNEVKAKVEQELADFERFFCGELGNEQLAKPERAIIATYLTWKHRVGAAESKDAK